MTIAACYVCPEGVVIGADSTTTNRISQPGKSEDATHHFNYGQKIFEVGENSCIAIASWGLGSLTPHSSYRTLIARLGDHLIGAPAKDMGDVSARWISLFWDAYCTVLATERARAAELHAKSEQLTAKGEQLTEEEAKEFLVLRQNCTVGFCVGGHAADRRPQAYEIWFRPYYTVAPTATEIPLGFPKFWGWSNLLNRLNYGLDDTLLEAIIKSGKWSGTDEELVNIALENRINQKIDLPLRDAIDWIYASIYTTIKAMKFSQFNPYCGGPIEIAAITTDRRFRWVRHKALDAAIDY